MTEKEDVLQVFTRHYQLEVLHNQAYFKGNQIVNLYTHTLYLFIEFIQICTCTFNFYRTTVHVASPAIVHSFVSSKTSVETKFLLRIQLT